LSVSVSWSLFCCCRVVMYLNELFVVCISFSHFPPLAVVWPQIRLFLLNDGVKSCKKVSIARGEGKGRDEMRKGRDETRREEKRRDEKGRNETRREETRREGKKRDERRREASSILNPYSSYLFFLYISIFPSRFCRLSLSSPSLRQ
jgi:hypothetical protein